MISLDVKLPYILIDNIPGLVKNRGISSVLAMEIQLYHAKPAISLCRQIVKCCLHLPATLAAPQSSPESILRWPLQAFTRLDLSCVWPSARTNQIAYKRPNKSNLSP